MITARSATVIAFLIAIGSGGAPAAAAAQSTAQGSQSAPAASAKVVVYKGASLIDGTGASLRANMAIVAKGDSIAAVTSAAALPDDLPPDAEIVDTAGLYVVPGLIDAHVHLATSPNRSRAEAVLRQNLYSGVTAVRDMAGDARAVAELARAALVGEIPAPDIYFSAVMAGEGFFSDPRTLASSRGASPGKAPWMQEITNQTDLTIAVAQARGTFATGIKIYSDLSPQLVRKITAEAHDQGIRVWAHAAVFPTRPGDVIGAGVDVVSHTWLLAYQLAPQTPPRWRDLMSIDPKPIIAKYSESNPEIQRLFEEMRRRGTILDATMRTGIEGEKMAPGVMDMMARMTRQAFGAGVPIAAGTDGHGRIDEPYPPLHDELELLATKVGMPAVQVIRSATYVGAMTVGREKEMGTIEPGKLANLVFVSENPLDSVSNLRKIVLTVKRGVRYPRQEYQPRDQAASP